MRILVNRDGQQLGPYTPEEASAALQSGTLAPTDLAWAEGTPSWVPLSTLLAGGAPEASPSLRGSAGGGFPVGERTTPGIAITSLVLGIFSYICGWIFVSIPAVICGHIARGKIAREPHRYTGSGVALAGLITGYLNIVLLPVAAAIAYPAIQAAVKQGQQTVVLTNARTIAVGCKTYASAHDGKFPATIEELVPEFIPTEASLRGPNVAEGTGFVYLQAGKTDTQSDEVLVASKWTNAKGQRAVAHVNGSAQMEQYDLP